MGVHWLDRLRYLAASEAVAVSCETRHTGWLSSAGEEMATVLIAFESGAVGTLVHSWASHHRHLMLQVDGEEGSLVTEGGTVALFGKDNKEKHRWDAAVDFEASFGGTMAALLDWVETGDEAMISGRDNLGTMAIMDGAYRSAAEGRRVDL